MHTIDQIYYANKCNCRNNYNFGDFVTPYIYKKIHGREAIHGNTGKHVLGAGSILRSSNSSSIVWGTGFMFGTEPKIESHKILSVRGKLTRQRLLKTGIQCPASYGDIGLILPHFYNANTEKKYKLGIIPHYIDETIFKKIGHTNDSTVVIDVTDPIETVVNNIQSCEYTISSSLHGIIVSHAYNVKSMWIRMSNLIAGGNFKFRDYYSSVLEKGWENLLPFMYKQPVPINEMINLINGYPNPEFPINTKPILDLCPFK